MGLGLSIPQNKLYFVLYKGIKINKYVFNDMEDKKQ